MPSSQTLTGIILIACAGRATSTLSIQHSRSRLASRNSAARSIETQELWPFHLHLPWSPAESAPTSDDTATGFARETDAKDTTASEDAGAKGSDVDTTASEGQTAHVSTAQSKAKPEAKQGKKKNKNKAKPIGKEQNKKNQNDAKNPLKEQKKKKLSDAKKPLEEQNKKNKTDAKKPLKGQNKKNQSDAKKTWKRVLSAHAGHSHELQHLPASPPVCEDTAEWSNVQGYTCANYVNNSWCEDGLVAADSELPDNVVGEESNHPEANCCACGKQQKMTITWHLEVKAKEAAKEVDEATIKVERLEDGQVSGETASLDEDGYTTVVKLYDNSEMGAFISRIVRAHGAHVDDAGGSVASIAPYYSGKKGFKTYAALCKEIQRQPWASGFTDEATVVETDAYTRLAFKVYEKKEVAEMARIKAGRFSRATSTSNVTGSDAALDEAGYQGVAVLKDDSEMHTYIKRVIASHHATITDTDEVDGGERLEDFAKHYGSENRQRLRYMEDSLAKVGWIRGWQAASPTSGDDSLGTD